jgi:hypothetical protein
MFYATLNLLTNCFITGLTIVGAVTIVNKVGKCFDIIETNENGIEKAFEYGIKSSLDELNGSLDSIQIIYKNLSKGFILGYELYNGNKIIKKTDEGKILVLQKTDLYKDQIDELNNKVRRYQEEIEKIKDIKIKNKSVNRKKKDHIIDGDNIIIPKTAEFFLTKK